MYRAEYLKELESLLQDISREERTEAMTYYENYFEDAGPDMDEKIIEELGSPTQTAAAIKADLVSEAPVNPVKDPVNSGESGRNAERSSGGLSAAAIVLICIFAIPVGIPLAAVAFALIVSFLAVIFSFVCVFFFTGVGFVIGGVISLVFGVFQLAFNPAYGVLAMGTGLVLTGLGIPFTYLGIRLCTKLFPAFFRGVGRLSGRLFGRRREREV